MQIDINVALNERKKKKKINETVNKDAPMKSPISPFILSALIVRIYGIPETLRSIPVSFSNLSIFGTKSFKINTFLSAVFTSALFM
ncbi:hypothetical protein D3C72_995940 [compost metagenome]